MNTTKDRTESTRVGSPRGTRMAGKVTRAARRSEQPTWRRFILAHLGRAQRANVEDFQSGVEGMDRGHRQRAQYTYRARQPQQQQRHSAHHTPCGITVFLA